MKNVLIDTALLTVLLLGGLLVVVFVGIPYNFYQWWQDRG